MKYEFKYALEKIIGSGGIRSSDIDAALPILSKIRDRLISNRTKDSLRFMDLPYDLQMVTRIKELAFEHLNRWENIVILGIGGSALGNKMIFSSLSHNFHNVLPRKKRQRKPRFFVADNIDPKFFSELLQSIDIDKTLFNVISKSGTTAETAATFSIVWDKLKEKVGETACDHIVAITDPNKGVLCNIVKEEGIATLPTPEGVEGRFSVLSDVGLFSSILLGIDIDSLLKGAREMDDIFKNAQPLENPPLVNAFIHYIADTKYGKNISVLMPYSNNLLDFGDWYCQLWAESLGKKLSRSGKIVNTGQTPVVALGASDQHSQIQLYNEGPNDKIFTFIGVGDYKSDSTIPDIYPEMEAISYLGGHTLGNLIYNEMKATMTSLSSNGRPNIRITIPSIDAFELGKLIFMYEIQTAVAGELYDVNAFDQPGVEDGKLYTFGLLGRSGFEGYRKEVDNWEK